MPDQTTRSTRSMVIREIEGHKFEAVLATETPVDRQGYTEVLRISPSAVDLERFPIALLRSHDMSDLPIGVVSNPRFNNGELIADISISDSEDGKEVV